MNDLANPKTTLTPDKQADLRTAFEFAGGEASAYVIGLIAARSVQQLAAEGWITPIPGVGRWDENYRPGPRLLEVDS